MWYLYVVKCNDNSLYCGITKNVQSRVLVHNKGTGAKYTRSRLPVALYDFCKISDSKSDALKIEYAFKRLSRKKKLETLDLGLIAFSKGFLCE